MKIINEKFIEFDIKSILEYEEQSSLLIGDKTKKHILPTLNTGKHRDLASISSHTVSILDLVK